MCFLQLWSTLSWRPLFPPPWLSVCGFLSSLPYRRISHTTFPFHKCEFSGIGWTPRTGKCCPAVNLSADTYSSDRISPPTTKGCKRQAWRCIQLTTDSLLTPKVCGKRKTASRKGECRNLASKQELFYRRQLTT